MAVRQKKVTWKSCRTLTAEELELFEISSDGKVRRAKNEGVQRCKWNHLITYPNVLEKPYSGLQYCRACFMTLGILKGDEGPNFAELVEENYVKIMRGDFNANRVSRPRS